MINGGEGALEREVIGPRCYEGMRKTGVGGATRDREGRVIQRERKEGDMNNTEDIWKSSKK